MYAQANAGSIRTLDQGEVDRALSPLLAAIDGDTKITAKQASKLVGKSVHTLAYWVRCGYLTPIPDTSPALYRKADVLGAKAREMNLGRPKKT